MNNFNLHYECLDERDDYHAILKRQSKINHNQTSTLNQVDEDDYFDFGINLNIEEDYGNPSIIGPNTIKKAQQMIETDIMMNQAGYLDPVENSIIKTKIHPVCPTLSKTAAQWKQIMKQC